MTTKPHRDFRFHAPAVLRVFHWHLTHCPPFWMVRRNVTRSAIQAALQRGQLEPEPWDTALHVLRLRSAAARRRWHAGRCAYLVTHGWTDGDRGGSRSGTGRWPLDADDPEWLPPAAGRSVSRRPDDPAARRWRSRAVPRLYRPGRSGRSAQSRGSMNALWLLSQVRYGADQSVPSASRGVPPRIGTPRGGNSNIRKKRIRRCTVPMRT